MKLYLKIRLTAVLLIFASSAFAAAVESTDSVTALSPVINLNYLCSNDSIILSAEIYVKRETGSFALKNAEIEFRAVAGDKTANFGKIKTDDAGVARFAVPANVTIPADKESKTTYIAGFAGKGDYLPVSAEVSYKRARIILTFSQEDSVRTINFKVVQFDENGKEKPVTGEKVNFYVPRMLSNLKIGEADPDAEGGGSLVFPGGVVGDSLGNISIYAMIEESDNFGFVRSSGNVTWGVPKHYFTAERPTRELWTPIAPMWMIITLIIMLTGVWGHYLYAVIQLIIIKRHNKQNKDLI